MHTSATEPAHILIVDDDPGVRHMFSLLLGNAGYRTSVAKTGGEALSYLQLLTPDLLLIDMMLPDMDGQDVIAQLKADTSKPFIPVMLVTANADLRSKVTGLDSGADDVLVKPVEVDELLARVRALLRLQRSQRSLQTEQRKTELLLHLTRELGGSLDLEVLLTRFLDHLADAVGAVRASIILVDPEEEKISCYSSSHNTATPILAEVLRVGVAGWALRECKSVVIDDTRDDDRWIGDADYQRLVRSVAAMPVLREGRALGVITLVHHRAGYFTDEHMDLLQSVAAQSAVALESAQLYSLARQQKELIERRAEELQRINQMSQHMAELMRPEQLLRLVVYMMHHTFNYPLVTIHMHEGEELVLYATAGNLDGHTPHIERMPVDSGVNGSVLRHNRLLHVDDLARSAFANDPFAGGMPVRSKLAVPIVLRREVLGTLDVQSDLPGAFGPNDEALLSTIANQLSVALGNARLYRTVEEERGRLDAVLRGAVDPILLIGPRDELLLANRAAEERLGIQLSTGYGRPLRTLLDQPELLELLSNPTPDDSRAVSLSSIEVQMPPDTTYSLSVSPVRSVDGQPLGRVAVLQDITAIKLLERQEQERMLSVFRRYVSPVVAERLLNVGQEIGQPTERTVVVLVADMRGFTALTERIGPHVLVERVLNRYFTAMTEVLYQFDGTIDKFLGDGLIGVFGSPITHADDPQRALLASVQMQRAFAALRSAWRRELNLDLGMGIGVSYGQAVVGNIGSEQRLDYTLIGDVVNTASRLSGIARAGQVIVSHHLVHALPPDWNAAGPLVPLGKVELKGKQDPHMIYEVCFDTLQSVGEPHIRKGNGLVVASNQPSLLTQASE